MEEEKNGYPSSENVLNFEGRDWQELGSYADEAIGMPGMSAEKEKVFHREESFSEKRVWNEEEPVAEAPEQAFFSDMEFRQYTEEELKLEPKKVSWLDARNDTGDEVPEQQPDDYTLTGVPLPENLKEEDVLKICLQDDSELSNESARINEKRLYAAITLVMLIMLFMFT